MKLVSWKIKLHPVIKHGLDLSRVNKRDIPHVSDTVPQSRNATVMKEQMRNIFSMRPEKRTNISRKGEYPKSHQPIRKREFSMKQQPYKGSNLQWEGILHMSFQDRTLRISFANSSLNEQQEYLPEEVNFQTTKLFKLSSNCTLLIMGIILIAHYPMGFIPCFTMW